MKNQIKTKRKEKTTPRGPTNNNIKQDDILIKFYNTIEKVKNQLVILVPSPRMDS